MNPYSAYSQLWLGQSLLFFGADVLGGKTVVEGTDGVSGRTVSTGAFIPMLLLLLT